MSRILYTSSIAAEHDFASQVCGRERPDTLNGEKEGIRRILRKAGFVRAAADSRLPAQSATLP